MPFQVFTACCVFLFGASAAFADDMLERSRAIADAVGARHPEDRAIGFEVGELRGAFVIDWSIKEEESP